MMESLVLRSLFSTAGQSVPEDLKHWLEQTKTAYESRNWAKARCFSSILCSHWDTNQSIQLRRVLKQKTS
ncbi:MULTISPECIES: hypothetical protein [unclassified Leptolyngbya]|uniref:hypothetical protein n=1 Tax=unclassified Leptolyngbya TaxID=2650499 RepID=UPI003D318542